MDAFSMFHQFETWFTTHTDFTAEELEQMRALAIPRRLRKRQFLLQEGDVCVYKSFILKGLFKTSLTKPDGMEVVMRFTPENNWVVDPGSYNFQVPSKYNIEALEDAEILQWSYDNVVRLATAVPRFRAYSEYLMMNSINAGQERILQNISLTSEEKYEAFINTFPDVFQRVPLHMVASYLGVSRETLSRIRQQQVKR